MPSKVRTCKPGLAGIFLLALSCSTALADERGAGAPGRGTYVSLFGGGGVSSSSDVTQFGTVLFPEAVGGALSVHATGRSDTSGVGLGGLQIGHEWGSTGSRLLPALEIEGFYLANTQRVTLDNPGPRLPEHTFDDTFRMHNAVFLANVVLSFPAYQRVIPYVGGGLGAARISISGAESAQTNPPESGINHFNSGPDSTSWSFAAQAKAGVRIALGDSAYVFGEYRYLFVGSADHIFGPTVYPTHAPTTAWTVHFDDMSNHLAVGGIGFNF